MVIAEIIRDSPCVRLNSHTFIVSTFRPISANIQFMKPTYYILFDTQSLRGEPIRPALIEFIKNYLNKEEIAIKLMLPEVVREEFKKYILSRVAKAKEPYNSRGK